MGRPAIMVIVIVIVIVIEVMMLVFVLGRARFSTVCAAAFGHAMCGGYEHGVLSSFPSSSSSLLLLHQW